MTLPSNLNKHTYVGNGLQTAWPFTFPIFSSSDIKVYLTNVSTEIVSEVTSNYSVDIDNSQVTYPVSGTALTSDYKLTILRVVGITQETSLINQGAFLPKVIEKALDKLTAISQQLDEGMERSVKVQIGSSTDPDNLIAELKADAASAASSAVSASNSAEVAAEVLSETQTVAQTVADETVEAASAQLQSYVNTAETAKNEAANSANEAKAAAESVQSYIGHVSDTDNPHETTAAQVGSYTKAETDAAIGAALSVPAVPGLTNYIASGLNVHAGTGLQVIVEPGRAAIAEKSLDITAEIPIGLSARMASLLYLKGDKTVGKIDAALSPVDAYTVARWDFSGWDGVSPIPNSAVGVNGNTIAVANSLTKSGTVSRVDGEIGYAAQGDGSTGKFVSANYTGFPIGTVEREIQVRYTAGVSGTLRMILFYGATTTSNGILIGVNTNGNLMIGDMAANYDTGLLLDQGKTYYIVLTYNGTSFTVFVDGAKIYSLAVAINTTNAVLNLLTTLAGWSYGNGAIHSIDIRNKMHTAAETADSAQRLLIPCRYYSDASKPDYNDIRNVLPSNAVAIVKVRTSSSAVSETDKTYGIGRREGAVGGNRRQFLGWKYYSGQMALKWDNPFGTRRIKTYYTWAQDANGTSECDVEPFYYSGSSFYGLQAGVNTQASRILIASGLNGVTYFNGIWQTSGYIGCYVEVIE